MDHCYPKTFLEALTDSIQYVEKCRTDSYVKKEDVLDSMENRLCFMLRKMVAAPTSTSFSFFLAPIDGEEGNDHDLP